MSTLELNVIGVPVARELLLIARRLIAQEPRLEEAHYALMQLLGRAGQRQAAMAQYQACRRVLLEEVGMKLHPLLQRYLGCRELRRSMVALAA